MRLENHEKMRELGKVKRKEKEIAMISRLALDDHSMNPYYSKKLSVYITINHNYLTLIKTFQSIVISLENES